MTTKYWLMKTEPETYSWQDLVAKPQHCDRWEGVRNYQARNFMRDEFAKGQEVFIYHSSTREPAIVGIARVAREAYPDLTALDDKSPYFDLKSVHAAQSRWVTVDVQATQVFAEPISLKRLRLEKDLQNMALLQRG
ncbi:MAG: EVE domain-containing protein, partial [Proteobacteria bacterium]|nr:EVE domain-containing protein [Pseudomonadota bacterium]